MRKDYISQMSPQEVYDTNQQLIDILYNIVRSVNDDPQISLAKVTRGGKPTFNIIYDAEDQFRRFVRYCFRSGQEGDRKIEALVAGDNRDNLDLKSTEAVYAVVNMVDSEDALEYDIQTWCVSVVFFNPQLEAGKRILGAFVGLHSQEVYFATNRLKGPYVQGPKGKPKAVSGPSSIRSLAGARICFSGEKACKVAGGVSLGAFTGDRSGSGSSNHDRKQVYAFAATPMIMRLVDTGDTRVQSMDAVIETTGKFPYEVIAGAYIAKKSGATVIDHESGEELAYENLEAALMTPFSERSKLRLITAATPQLASQVVALLNESGVDFAAGRLA